MPILIIIAIVILFLVVKFLYKHRYLIKYAIKAFIGFWIWGILGGALGKLDDDFGIWCLYYFIAVIGFYAVKMLTFKFRVRSYINNYLVQVVADNSRTNQLTEESFFSQPKTKKLLSEKANVENQTSRQFMQDCLYSTVMMSLKNTFINRLFENENVVNDRVFFYYEFNNYLYYLDEQGMDLIDVLENFNIVQSRFCYIEGAVFFSNELFERMTDDFIPFLTKNPKLSDVPFSAEYLSKTMYEQGMLSPYVSDNALECLRKDKELFEDDFIDLYGGVANEEIQIAIKQGKLNVQPNPNDKERQAYSLKHEDENGIIQSEYGMDFEQHRVDCDINLTSDQLDDLEGCPA